VAQHITTSERITALLNISKYALPPLQRRSDPEPKEGVSGIARDNTEEVKCWSEQSWMRPPFKPRF
jgi:hypothetical protein